MKRNTVFQLVGIALVIIGIELSITLIFYFCHNLLQGAIWGISIACLLLAESLFISGNTLRKNKIYKYIYLSIGIIIFIIASFKYLELFAAVCLIGTVLFLGIGFTICCRLLLKEEGEKNEGNKKNFFNDF